MKKISSLFVMAMMLLSIVPMTIADEENETDNSGSDDIEAEADVEVKGNTGQIRMRDKIEDRKDNREDVRDEKEDLRDMSNRDRMACIQKCQQQNGTSCEARCKGLDKLENIADKKEDRWDKAQDWKEKRQNLMQRLSIKDPEKLWRLQALNDSMIKKIEKLDMQNKEKFLKLTRGMQDEFQNLTDAQIRAHLKNITFERISSVDDLKDRKLPGDIIRNAREKFRNAHDRFEKARDEYKEAKDEYKNALDEGDKEKALAHAKEVLSKSADAMISHLERLIAKIEENENIEEERAVEMIAKLNVHIDELEAIKAKIDAATTPEEVRAAAKELKQKWHELRHKARLFAEHVIESRIKNIIKRAELMEARLDTLLSKLEENGTEVDVDAQLDEFSSLVAAAKEHFRQAQDKLMQAQDSDSEEETKALVDEAKELSKQAHTELKDAHQVLVEILKKIKEAGASIELDVNATVEIESLDVESQTNAEASA